MLADLTAGAVADAEARLKVVEQRVRQETQVKLSESEARASQQTAAIAAMRKEERRRRREEAKARRTDDGMASHAESGSEDSSESDESSDESDDDARSAQSELDALIRALDSRPELRAAAPCDEVESETLALQYELLWQSQANRAVLSAVLKRVAARCEEEGETFARVEGDVAEAAQMMSKVREVRRMLKREKREADQRAALEAILEGVAGVTAVDAQHVEAEVAAGGVIEGLVVGVLHRLAQKAEDPPRTGLPIGPHRVERLPHGGSVP